MIHSIMFLHSKKEQIITIGTGLQKIKLVYNKRQHVTTLNWESDNKLKDTKYFNKLDLIQRYNNV